MATDRVVNILFHGIGTPRRTLEPGEERYWVSEARFHEILDEVATWPQARISFDDGNISDIEVALPALRERGLVATFFVLAGRLGRPGSLGPDDVRTLHRHGMTIGSHGMHHRSWRTLSRDEAHEEFVAAREMLAEVVGSPIDQAGCPFGQYDRRVLGELRRCGYRRVFTSDRRPARAGAWLQARYSVMCDDTAATLRAAVLHPGLVRRVRSGLAGVVKRWR